MKADLPFARASGSRSMRSSSSVSIEIWTGLAPMLASYNKTFVGSSHGCSRRNGWHFSGNSPSRLTEPLLEAGLLHVDLVSCATPDSSWLAAGELITTNNSRVSLDITLPASADI